MASQPTRSLAVELWLWGGNQPSTIMFTLTTPGASLAIGITPLRLLNIGGTTGELEISEQQIAIALVPSDVPPEAMLNLAVLVPAGQSTLAGTATIPAGASATLVIGYREPISLGSSWSIDIG